MKKIIFALFILGAVTASAQSDKITYGVKAGLNYSNIIVKDAALTVDLGKINPALEGKQAKGTGGFNFDPQTSFYVGATVDFPVKKWFHVQAELLFVQNKGKGAMAGTIKAFPGVIAADVSVVRPEELKLSYIQVPILAKFYPIKNLPVMIGPYLGYGVGFQGKNISAGIENPKYKDISYMYKKVDFGAVFAAAYEFDFGLFVEGRYVFGAQKTLKKECLLKDIDTSLGSINIDAYTKDIKGQNNSFQFGVGFRF